MSTKTHPIKSWHRLIPVAGLLLVLGLILSFIVVKAHPVLRWGAAPSTAASSLRSSTADAARYEAMAQYFAAREAANLKRSRAADAARYTAMAQYFVSREAADLKRSRAADAARYEAMVRYFAGGIASTRTAGPGH